MGRRSGIQNHSLVWQMDPVQPIQTLLGMDRLLGPTNKHAKYFFENSRRRPPVKGQDMTKFDPHTSHSSSATGSGSLDLDKIWHGYTLFHIILKYSKASSTEEFLCIYIECLIYIFHGLGMGRGREFQGGFFIGFQDGGKGGLLSDFATVPPFMCLVPAVTRHKKGI